MLVNKETKLMFILFICGASCAIVIVVGSELFYLISNPKLDCLHLSFSYYPLKGMNRFIENYREH